MNDNSGYTEIELCLTGKKLYGNDFSQEMIDAWFADEREGYYNLTQSAEQYTYGYYALNMYHGYSRLPKQQFKHVLGVGSAYGCELEPILSHCDRISIVEPSDGFKNNDLHGVPIEYIKPLPTGEMSFESNSLDLITCLGVLHHIPNVEKVVKEFFRILSPGGYALVREPIISMGDWRNPRTGLTKNERGIPLMILREFVKKAGFKVSRESKCVFSLTSRLKYLVSGPVYNNHSIVVFDAILCSLPIWQKCYHARNVLQKLRPTSVFYVLQKPV